MAKSYKQKIFADLDQLIDKYPQAKVSDLVWALGAFTEAVWRAHHHDKNGQRRLEKGEKRYRLA